MQETTSIQSMIAKSDKHEYLILFLCNLLAH